MERSRTTKYGGRGEFLYLFLLTWDLSRKLQKWRNLSLSKSASSSRYTNREPNWSFNEICILYLEADSVVVTIDTLPLTFIFELFAANFVFLLGKRATGGEIASADGWWRFSCSSTKRQSCISVDDPSPSTQDLRHGFHFCVDITCTLGLDRARKIQNVMSSFFVCYWWAGTRKQSRCSRQVIEYEWDCSTFEFYYQHDLTFFQRNTV